jgi:ribonucleoside-diphosphate reductase alpha chain
LRRVKKITREWVNPGKRSGQNGHNVSATISLRENEWSDAGEWMWENRKHYNGLAVLPYDGGTYQQAPFEDCSKEKFEAMLATLADVDLTKIVEEDDNTDLKGEAACAGGECEIT